MSDIYKVPNVNDAVGHADVLMNLTLHAAMCGPGSYDGQLAAQAALEITALRARIAELTAPPVQYQNCKEHAGQPWNFTVMFGGTQRPQYPVVVCPICKPPKSGVLT